MGSETEDMQTVNLRLPRALWFAVRQAAFGHTETATAYVTRALEAALAGEVGRGGSDVPVTPSGSDVGGRRATDVRGAGVRSVKPRSEKSSAASPKVEADIASDPVTKKTMPELIADMNRVTMDEIGRGRAEDLTRATAKEPGAKVKPLQTPLTGTVVDPWSVKCGRCTHAKRAHLHKGELARCTFTGGCQCHEFQEASDEGEPF